MEAKDCPIGFLNWFNERISKSCIKLAALICRSVNKDTLKE